MAVVDDISIPITKLDKIFNIIDKKNAKKVPASSEAGSELPQATQALQVQQSTVISPKTTVVLIKRGRDTVGIVVDKLIKEQEVIVKPMPKILRGITGFSGSTILGNGDTILILDAITLLEDTKKLLNKK